MRSLNREPFPYRGRCLLGGLVLDRGNGGGAKGADAAAAAAARAQLRWYPSIVVKAKLLCSAGTHPSSAKSSLALTESLRMTRADRDSSP